MDRPLDYTPCKCTETGDRVIWAVQGAILDELPNGQRVVAVPRIVGAYVGSFAQAAWRPSRSEQSDDDRAGEWNGIARHRGVGQHVL